MAPILEELRVELKGKVEVVFINVREDSMSAQLYDVRMIPTQVFQDDAGNEVARHEGFMSKEEILEQLAAMGVPLGNK